jgi:hypothetical protein
LPEQAEDPAVPGGGGGAVCRALPAGGEGEDEEGEESREEGVGGDHRGPGDKSSGGVALARPPALSAR